MWKIPSECFSNVHEAQREAVSDFLKRSWTSFVRWTEAAARNRSKGRLRPSCKFHESHQKRVYVVLRWEIFTKQMHAKMSLFAALTPAESFKPAGGEEKFSGNPS